MKVFLALALTLCVCATGFAQQPDKIDKTDQVLKQLGEIAKTLDAMKKDTDARIGKTEADVKQIRSDIADLKKAVDGLPKTAQLPPAKEPIKSPTVPLQKFEDATVLIANNWSSTANVVINGQLHKVVPGSTKPLHVPPGKFTYQCLDVPNHLVQQRTLVAGETFRIDISPSRPAVVQQPTSQPLPIYYYSPPTYYPGPGPIYYGPPCGR